LANNIFCQDKIIIYKKPNFLFREEVRLKDGSPSEKGTSANLILNLSFELGIL